MLDDCIELRPTADMHVHLRDGEMMELVTKTIRQGGVDTVYVMPNLVPPITTVEAALAYRARLQPLAPDVTFLMTLYLHSSITPATIAEAAAAGISGVKVYPQGVTTNSDRGVLDLESYYPVLAAMQEHDLVLNLHGEVPSTPVAEFAVRSHEPDGVVTVLNAEQRFLPVLRKLHTAFPNLRIVLEHCSTREALQVVRDCGPTVAATITAHHLWSTTESWCGNAYNYCKPVPKTPEDRLALVRAVMLENKGKFFFGSDSAPHPIQAKQTGLGIAAGCFTQGWTTQLVVGAMEKAVELGWLSKGAVSTELLEDFLSNNARKFYKLGERKEKQQTIILEQKREKIPSHLTNSERNVQVVPFKAQEEVWSLRWKQ